MKIPWGINLGNVIRGRRKGYGREGHQSGVCCQLPQWPVGNSDPL